MDKYRFEFCKDESGKYVDGYKNGDKIPLISDINIIEWVKHFDVELEIKLLQDENRSLRQQVKINKSFEELKKLYDEKMEIVQNNKLQIDTKKIQIINLKPNDILVLKTPYVPSKQALDNVKKYLKDILVKSGYDNEILIILKTDELQIIRKDD
jgi:hypothetical protein